jgi:hypothetical protein
VFVAAGFIEIDAYEGNEVPKELQEHLIFMEKDLPGKETNHPGDAQGSHLKY